MSEASTLALPLPASARADDAALDPSLPHRFAFAPQRWTVGVGRCIQAALMLGAGGFLLSQAPSTPKLTTQIAIVGSLLGAGGLALLIYALSDFTGSFTVDPQSLRGRFGLWGFSVSWNDLEKWQVHSAAANTVELPSVRLWAAHRPVPFIVPGGHLREGDHGRIEQLLQKLAPEKQHH